MIPRTMLLKGTKGSTSNHLGLLDAPVVGIPVKPCAGLPDGWNME